MRVKILATITLLLTTILTYGQRGLDNRRSYEVWGLPDGDEVGSSLKIAIPLLIVGFLIAYIFMWSANDKEKKSDTSTNIGCFGIIVMAVGAFFLLPLLTWVEYIFVNIVTFGFAVLVVGVILFFIYGLFKK